MKGNQGGDATPAHDLGRREFLEAGAAAALLGAVGWPHSVSAQAIDSWKAGQLAHLIPTASHERFLIKASFKAPLADTPRLTVDGKAVDGVQTDRKAASGVSTRRRLRPATSTSCASPTAAAHRCATPGR